MKIRVLLLCGAMLVPSTGWSVTLGCANPLDETEKAICYYPDVKASDDRMEKQYYDLMFKLSFLNNDKVNTNSLMKNQSAWIEERQKVCGGNADCLLSYNNKRYNEISQVIQQLNVASNQPAQTSPFVPPQQSYAQQPSRTYSRTSSYSNDVPRSNGGSLRDENGCVTVSTAGGSSYKNCDYSVTTQAAGNVLKGAAALGITTLLLNEMVGDVFGGGMGGGEASSSFTPKEHHHKHEDTQVDPYPSCSGGLYGDCHNPNYQSWK